jgi:hypothetical protein
MGIPLRSPLPPERHWNYNIPVFGVNCTIQNSIGENDYLFEVNLTDDNFDFSRAQPDGGDIEFKDSLGRNLRSFVHRWSQENKTGQCIVASYEPGDSDDQTFTMFYGNSHKDYDYPKEAYGNIIHTDDATLPFTLWWNQSGDSVYPFTVNTTMPMGYYTFGIQGAYNLDRGVFDPDTENCGPGGSFSRVAACGWGDPNQSDGNIVISYGLDSINGIQGYFSKSVPRIAINRSLPGQFGYGGFYIPYPTLIKVWINDSPTYLDNRGRAKFHIYRDTKLEGFPRYDLG